MPDGHRSGREPRVPLHELLHEFRALSKRHTILAGLCGAVPQVMVAQRGLVLVPACQVLGRCLPVRAVRRAQDCLLQVFPERRILQRPATQVGIPCKHDEFSVGVLARFRRVGLPEPLQADGPSSTEGLPHPAPSVMQHVIKTGARSFRLACRHNNARELAGVFGLVQGKGHERGVVRQRQAAGTFIPRRVRVAERLIDMRTDSAVHCTGNYRKGCQVEGSAVSVRDNRRNRALVRIQPGLECLRKTCLLLLIHGSPLLAVSIAHWQHLSRT